MSNRARANLLRIPALLVVCLVSFALWPSWRSELRELGYYPTIVKVVAKVSVVDTEPSLSLWLMAEVHSGKTPGSSLLQGTGSTMVPRTRENQKAAIATFQLSGWVSAEGLVSMMGEVTDATDPALVGQRVTISASERTGEVILGFGELILEGTGKVTVQ